MYIKYYNTWADLEGVRGPFPPIVGNFYPKKVILRPFYGLQLSSFLPDRLNLAMRGYSPTPFIAGRTIKHTNFPAKYTNSRSKLHWNIHVVLCQVSITWNKRWGIGIPQLHDHAERHSAFNTSSKWILLIFYFYDIFGVFFQFKMWCLQVYWH